MAKKFYYHGKKDDSKQATPAEPRYAAEFMNKPVESIGVSAPTAELLAKNKINTAGDLSVRSERDMFKVQGFNKRMLFELRDALKSQNMTFAPEAKPEQKADKPRPDGQNKQDSTAQNGRDNRDRRGRNGNDDNNRDDRRNRNGNSDKGSKNQQNQRGRDGKQPQKELPPKPEKLTEPLPVERWRKIQKGDKWGFYDGFKTVIPAMYDEVYCFKDGLASVELDEKCGYIDSENNVVIPFDYETAMSFSEGYASVTKGVKFGYIDKENNLIIPFEYDAATAFEEGEAKVKKDGRWGTITPDGAVKWI